MSKLALVLLLELLWRGVEVDTSSSKVQTREPSALLPWKAVALRSHVPASVLQVTQRRPALLLSFRATSECKAQLTAL